MLEADGLGKFESRPQEQLTTLVKLFQEVDEQTAVCVWDPLSVVLRKQYQWVPRIPGLPAFQSQICLYQHERFSRKSLQVVGDAFHKLFVFEWHRLNLNQMEALGRVLRDIDFKRQFSFGAGLNLTI